jgi:parallel beta-helix repeat protein
MKTRLIKGPALLLAAALSLPAAASAGAAQVVVTTSIQAAVDLANPGDTVRVPPGVYHENVRVAKNNITINGSSGAILDGTGLTGDSGITVQSLTPSLRIDGFTLSGLQIRNYSGNGVLLIEVDNFQIDHGQYVNNDEYGIFPILCSHGLVEFNQVAGSDDTGIYIGQSHDALIRQNHVSDCTVGIDVENSSNVIVQDNWASDNTIGMTAEVFPGLTETVTTDIQIIRNIFRSNNRPNPITDPDDILSLLPSGSGLLIIGADSVIARSNTITLNNSVGIAVVQLPPALAALDPRINPFPDDDEIRQNVVMLNGQNPDPKLAPFPGSDLIWDVSGTNNCWNRNVYNTSFPQQLPDCP